MPPRKTPGGAKKPRAVKSAHQLAKPIPAGTVLTDFRKKQWTVGKPVGSGGFGLIYLASAADQKGDPQYVVKVEPHGNGPLFCELNFYQRAAKPETVTDWIRDRGLPSLGMPLFIASGSYERSAADKYRFMIMQRFGSDLQRLFEANHKSFPHRTVLQLAVRVLHVLEYIHAQGFVHADVKAANLLLGHSKAAQNQVYLVDYGLAFRYAPDGKHKEYKEDPRRCHDGTVEFTSRDAHKGVCPSRRGDLEILGYCLLQWLCGVLPWENNLENKDYVRDQKVRFMQDVPLLVKTCFGAKKPPDELRQYLEYVGRLGYTDEPDYARCRQFFTSAMRKHGFSDAGALQLTGEGATPKTKPAATGRGKKRVSSPPPRSDSDSNSGTDAEEDEAASPPAKQRAGAARGRGRGRATPKIKSPAAEEGPPRKPVGIRGPPITPRPKSPGSRSASRSAGSAAQVNGVARRGAVAKQPRGSRVREVAKEVSSVATQTSPGLKGLERSWRKK